MLYIIRRVSLPGSLLAISLVVFAITWGVAPRDTLSGVLPSTIHVDFRPGPTNLLEQIETRPSANAALVSGEMPALDPVFGVDRPFRVVFTFDDGPHRLYTKKLLSVLAEHEVRATFFVNGYWMDPRRRDDAKLNQQLLLAIHKAGHEVGNHTYNHAWLPRLTPGEQTREVMDNVRLVERITGVKPRYFRPPYGTITWHTSQLLRRQGIRDIRWNSTSDEEQETPEVTARKVLGWIRARRGGDRDAP